MDESTSGALLRFAEAVDAQTRALSKVVYTLADAVSRLESAVGRLDGEMAELRDEIVALDVATGEES